MTARVEIAAAAGRRLPVAGLRTADIAEATIAATFIEEAAAVIAGVERFAATGTAIVVVLDGKATSAFPDKSIQKIFASVRDARRARPGTLARYTIGRVFWMASRRGRNRFVSR
jgi:hypothetical protein